MLNKILKKVIALHTLPKLTNLLTVVLPTVGAGGSGSDFAERPDLFPTVAFFIVETT